MVKINLLYINRRGEKETLCLEESPALSLNAFIKSISGAQVKWITHEWMSNDKIPLDALPKNDNGEVDIVLALKPQAKDSADNFLTNLNETLRLIECIANSNADVLVLGCGSYSDKEEGKYQQNPAFARKLMDKGQRVSILNIDPGFAHEPLAQPNQFRAYLDPALSLTDTLLNLLQQKLAVGTRIIIFDNTSIIFSEFTCQLARRNLPALHKNLECVVGHGLVPYGLVPIVLLDAKLFTQYNSPMERNWLMQYFMGLNGLQMNPEAMNNMESSLGCKAYKDHDSLMAEDLFRLQPVESILASVQNCDGSNKAKNIVYQIFLQNITHVQTLDELHALLPILNDKNITKNSDVLDVMNRLFVSKDNVLVEKMKNGMCAKLSELITTLEPKDKDKYITLARALDFQLDPEIINKTFSERPVRN